ncbi:hypothetical protein A7P95_06670 [Eikenella longinqua]|uniref:Uncharacterized protein n=1 Tax=Eikenella longinqua TaxID=1795827 RepID=A0A1A9RVL6_9NEIS|nr:hypothetical protein A7P95_06670 [Eikenella longinqua]
MTNFSCFFIDYFSVKYIHFLLAHIMGNFLLHRVTGTSYHNRIQCMMSIVFFACFMQAPATTEQGSNLPIGGKYLFLTTAF